MLINTVFNCTQHEFDLFKSRDNVSLTCQTCYQIYTRTKKNILDTFTKHNTMPKFCSRKCNAKNQQKIGNITIHCKVCNTTRTKLLNQFEKTNNHFCSKSCATSFNNKNKTIGTRRSKLEIYLEEQLTTLYPNLEILYSNKEAIGSELDIYIPSLKLAFEIQGIFHYEPIFGQEKLDQIQKNDLEKIQRCKELRIDLVCINTKLQKRFTEKSSEKYLDIIINNITTQPPFRMD